MSAARSWKRVPTKIFLAITVIVALVVHFTYAFHVHGQPAQGTDSDWPRVTQLQRPWAYWWWMASAVDRANITRELERYQKAGLGGVHIIPIYGAKGYEDKFIDYLSPRWMEMLNFTVSEAKRLGMGVDMTTGSGWCFGGPHVTDEEANALVVVKQLIFAGTNAVRVDPKLTQAVVAIRPDGSSVDVTSKVGTDGTVDGAAWANGQRVYCLSQKPSGQKVKRAGPGGQGHMLNLFYPSGMRHYLEWFEDAFKDYSGALPRGMYHDSYEYRSDWAPDFLESFQKRRGYELQNEIAALFFDRAPITNAHFPIEIDRVARVKHDYCETVSDIMIEESLPLWADWSRRHGFLTRNEAHGSPGNLLDLYAVAAIPETEMFNRDRSVLVSKFASSAAHVAGKPLVSAETGTWLKEHFTETLADMKYLQDDLFLSGVNHIFYHGTCYSPDDAAWPGWLFYASYEMNPRNSVWRDVPTLNAYAARCQAILQAGTPDNDLLLYWPIHDFWQTPAGLEKRLTVHAREWLEEQPLGKTAAHLWQRGYSFDYISDRQVASASVEGGLMRVPGGRYRAVVVPPTDYMPVKTLQALVGLANAGAKILFQDRLPADVPGLGNLEARKRVFQELVSAIKPSGTSTFNQGQIVVGALEPSLAAVGITREQMFDIPGLMCLRRGFPEGGWYFIANRSADNTVKQWVPMNAVAKSALILDPLTGNTGSARIRQRTSGAGSEVYLQMEPGESLIVQCFINRESDSPAWRYWDAVGPTSPVTNRWTLRFISGGPALPGQAELESLGSWTDLKDAETQRFAGTAAYRVQFDMPPSSAQVGMWQIDLGRVCQSARVRLNGEEMGTLILPPFRVMSKLKPRGNILEVEVTNVSANRIRDLDRRGVKWKNFYDINFVGMDYKPLDTSGWPLAASGLLGPVTLSPMVACKAAANSH
jgi:hypothetical protein